MKYLLSIMVLTLVGSAGSEAARGAVLVTTDLGAGRGVSRTFAPGEVVTASIFMELTAPSDLSAYNFSVRFDPSELAYQSRDENDFGSLNIELATANPVSGGVAFQIDRATLGAGQGSPFGPINVATLSFLFTPAAADDAAVDLEAGLFSPGEDFFFSGNGTNVSGLVDFSGSAVSVSSAVAVPEPGSLAALGIAGAAAWSLRRRRRRAE